MLKSFKIKFEREIYDFAVSGIDMRWVGRQQQLVISLSD